MLLFLLGGCSKNQTAKVQTAGLNLRVDISYRENVYEGIFTSRDNYDCEFEFLSPQSLNGFALAVNGGEVIMKFHGIEQKIPQSDLTESLFMYEIYECLKEVPHQSIIEYQNEKIIYDGVCNGRAFTLQFDNQGYPAVLSVKSLDLTVKFHRY